MIEFRYTATQTITVYSKKIKDVKAKMNKLPEPGKKGIAFTGYGYQNSTEYLFTRLNEIKLIMVEEATTKGSRKNNFAELALRFGSGLADPREQNHRNSELFRGFCE